MRSRPRRVGYALVPGIGHNRAIVLAVRLVNRFHPSTFYRVLLPIGLFYYVAAHSTIMSRSKHTDPKAIRAARRIRAPRDERGAGDLGQRRRSGWERKQAGIPASARADKKDGRSRLRFVVQTPHRGFYHPAHKRDVLAKLKEIGPMGFYGLRLVKLGRLPEAGLPSGPVFGRYRAPDCLILFEQPLPPWRLSGLLQRKPFRRFEKAGAIVILLGDVGATVVDWPGDTLRQFMLKEILLHELGHHVLQHYKGKRRARVARTPDNECFAERFAQKHRQALRKGKRI